MNVDIHRCCMESASELKPCLCDQSSTEEAFIDVYIQNQTQSPLFLSSYSTMSNAGRGFVDVPGVWVVKPAECIRPGKTIFFRAYSGKFPIDNTEDCFFPIQFIAQVEYISIDQTKKLMEVLAKIRDGSESCEALQPFGLVEQRNTYQGAINIYQNTP